MPSTFHEDGFEMAVTPSGAAGSTTGLAPVLTPKGRLHLVPDYGTALPLELGQRLQEAFARGAGHGLLQLGAGEVGTVLPAVLSYWRELGTVFVTALCTTPDDLEGDQREVQAPPPGELKALAAAAPPMNQSPVCNGEKSLRRGRAETGPPPGVYRRHIVNLERVVAYVPNADSLLLELTDGTRLRASRRRARGLLRPPS